MTIPDILALDFDGVLCDGLPEYFWAAWQTYCQLWKPADSMPTPAIESAFGRLRPVIETGWEMPLLVYALVQGMPEPLLLANWPQISQQLLAEVALSSTHLAHTLDQTRDRAIQNHLPDWLALHRFYPEALDCLRSLLRTSHPTHPVIISTKEGRFIRQLLQQQGLDLTQLEIFGKETKQPKHQTLKEIQARSGSRPTIWFIEDRLATLLSIQAQPDLQTVGLYLATWGYNTAQERQYAQSDPQIQALSPEMMRQPLSAWLSTSQL